MTYERIPEELRAVSQWHCWKLVDGTKIPIQADGNSERVAKGDSLQWQLDL